MKEKSESAVLFFYEIKVLARAIHLENGVPIEVVVVDRLLGGDDDVDDGEDLIRAVEERLSFLRENGEVAGAAQVAALQQLLADGQQAFCFGSVCVHFYLIFFYFIFIFVRMELDCWELLQQQEHRALLAY